MFSLVGRGASGEADVKGKSYETILGNLQKHSKATEEKQSCKTVCCFCPCFISSYDIYIYILISTNNNNDNNKKKKLSNKKQSTSQNKNVLPFFLDSVFVVFSGNPSGCWWRIGRFLRA